MDQESQDRMLIEIHGTTRAIAVDMTHVKGSIQEHTQQIHDVKKVAYGNQSTLTRWRGFLKGVGWLCGVLVVAVGLYWKFAG